VELIAFNIWFWKLCHDLVQSLLCSICMGIKGTFFGEQSWLTIVAMLLYFCLFESLTELNESFGNVDEVLVVIYIVILW
jgi:hypothetical protein